MDRQGLAIVDIEKGKEEQQGMQSSMTLFSPFNAVRVAPMSDRRALAGSGLVLGLLLLAYWVSNYVLIGRVSADLSLYVIRPILWGGAGLVALALWRGLEDRPQPSRLLLGLAGLAAAFHITALLFTGLLFGFGHSPYARELLHITQNVWYLTVFIFGLEMSRAYLLEVWGRYNGALAFLAVSFLIAAIWVAPGQYEQLANGNDVMGRLSRTFMPGAAESLMLSFLASLGGPLPAIIYHLSLEAFRWVSPILPRMEWELALLVGTLTPALAMLIVRDSFFAKEEAEAPAETRKGRAATTLAAVLATMIVGLIWLNTGMLGVRPALVSGPSMKPYLGPGDVVIIKEVNANELKVGDVVKFQQGSRDVIHRIKAITPGPNGVFVFTQGDNNNTPDAPLPVASIEGKVVLKVPYVGWLPIELRELIH